MKVALPYGPGSVSIELPDGASVATIAPAAPASAVAIERALEPCADRAVGKASACIAIPDATRPPLARAVLPGLLARLAGIERIDIVVATGTHRPATAAEIEILVGAEIARRLPVRSHDASLGVHESVGRLASGVPVEIDAGWMHADLRIAFGVVEPHLLAGWSGGAKTICPGLASLATVRGVHRAAVARGQCGPGIVTGNPFRAEVESAARLAGVDVAIQLVGAPYDLPAFIAVGDLPTSVLRAIEFAVPHAVVDLANEFDVVVTTAGGWPLDRTLYQAAKGWLAGVGAVRPGGDVVLCAALDAGIGSSDFEMQLRAMPPTVSAGDASSPAPQRDAWMLQHIEQARARARLHLVSSLPAADAAALGFTPWADVPAALAGIAAAPVSTLFSPAGPQAILRTARHLRTLEGVPIAATGSVS